MGTTQYNSVKIKNMKYEPSPHCSPGRLKHLRMMCESPGRGLCPHLSLSNSVVLLFRCFLCVSDNIGRQVAAGQLARAAENPSSLGDTFDKAASKDLRWVCLSEVLFEPAGAAHGLHYRAVSNRRVTKKTQDNVYKVVLR